MVDVLILSEDTHPQAVACLSNFVRTSARLVVQNPQTQKLNYEPVSDEQSKFTMKANRWQSRKKRDQRGRRLLLKEIATWIEQKHFVIFHYDADAKWRDKNAQRDDDFKELIIQPLQQSGVPNVDDHLFAMVPHWAIEAWTYQNTKKAAKLARKDHDEQEANKFKHWEQNRAELDETDMTQKKASKLKDKHNLELVKSGWPAEAVYEVGKSFTAFVDTLKASKPFVKALEETRDYK